MRRSALGGLLALLGTLIVTTPTPAQAAVSSGNLIVNGDAEAGGFCTDDWSAATAVPGWTVQSGGLDVMCHSVASFGHPGDGDTPGKAFFAPGDFGDGSMSQRVDVSSAAAAIDGGGVHYDLSGWLGGWTVYGGYVAVGLHFQDANGNPVGATADLPTVSATDRGLHTEFLARSATGTVPVGTRHIQVEVQFLDTSSETGYLDNLSLTLDTPVAAPAPPAPPVSKVPGYDHVFMVMMENTDYSEIMNDPADTPFIHSLMSEGATMTDAHAVYHPSDENYLAVAGGDTYAHGATYWPDINSPERNLGDTVEAVGKTWKAYEQGIGSPCNAGKGGADSYYEPDDAPFINYTDISGDAARCAAHLFDTTQLTTDLQSAATTPNFSWIAADDYYDGEASGNGSAKSLRTQDGWLRQTLAPVMSSPAWTRQRSLILLTWDESAGEGYDHVATVAVGSQGTVPAGTTSPRHYDHYGIGRTIEDALGLPGLTANDTYATPLNDAFAPSTATSPTLTGDLDAVRDGGNVTLRYSLPSTAQVGAKNWIGIYPAGVKPGAQSSLTWAYTPNRSGAATFSTGKLNGAGSYDAYYLADDGYGVLAGPFRLTVG
ncbi:alkaline phosphatase family protein [Streptomyces sp. MS06]|uniref:alkaline phosphatase family protein n=1 Tax=Streptomyces sp. MS06 TaxID=3385974 RepID=UPI0039A0517A